MPDNSLIFLKLGGSLITDKAKPETVRRDVLSNCLAQIKQWMQENPHSRLVLGHGSGSFGHHTAKTFHTREGVSTEHDWLGYAKVWYSARKLNNYFIEACAEAGLPVVDFPISAAVITNNRIMESWNTEALRESLQHPLVPVVHGDVCIDHELGGTILSTEEIFDHLAGKLKPIRILVAGVERGVYSDYPENKSVIQLIPTDSDFSGFLKGSRASDVTGGMASKVTLMQALARANPGVTISIFSGLEENSIYKALSGETLGTRII
ncbi:MAG TPA: isopentenyl phosphate kinase [Anaerolineaceae bacterium]|nr:isopentenyl phosphate kinase [Anaerolineaceae bacterium]